MTWAFWRRYVEEAWVAILPEEWTSHSSGLTRSASTWAASARSSRS
jgi:hypothetical protein